MSEATTEEDMVAASKIIRDFFKSNAPSDRAVNKMIRCMAEGMGVTRRLAILNKVPSDVVGLKMVIALKKREVKAAGIISYDMRVSETGFEGHPPVSSKAVKEVRNLARCILQDTL